MASGRLRIPPRVHMDECMTCRVSHGGTVAAWRVHAHRLSSDIWSDHYGTNGASLAPVGRISAQDPQIFRMMYLDKGLGGVGKLEIATHDTLQLHCLCVPAWPTPLALAEPHAIAGTTPPARTSPLTSVPTSGLTRCATST